MSLAKRAGCFFHFTSDAHRLDTIAEVLKLAPYVEELGLTSEDVHPVFRSRGGM